MIVVDSGPLNFLIRLECAHILPALFGEVLLPFEAKVEMSRPGTPEGVRLWIDDAPVWLQVSSSEPEISPKGTLHIGEMAAVYHALKRPGSKLLMDDRRGRVEARRQGLLVTGTLAVLYRAAELDMLDFTAELQRLRTLGFRVSDAVAEHFTRR